MLGLGLVGVTLTQSVFTLGVGLTTAANTALVYSTAPVWGMLLAFALGWERPRISGVLGIGLCLVGVGAIVYGSLDFAGTSLVGDALILVAAVCWGSYTVLTLSFLRRYSALAVAAYAMTSVASPLSLSRPSTRRAWTSQPSTVSRGARRPTRRSAPRPSASPPGDGASPTSGRTASSSTSTSSPSSG